ncbi:hypothetical protein AUL38_11645 [Leucobacter sp. G161]|nr:hypothetical protein AUL38_11645 [Leucobacter sp. G161]
MHFDRPISGAALVAGVEQERLSHGRRGRAGRQRQLLRIGRAALQNGEHLALDVRARPDDRAAALIQRKEEALVALGYRDNGGLVQHRCCLADGEPVREHDRVGSNVERVRRADRKPEHLARVHLGRVAGVREARRATQLPKRHVHVVMSDLWHGDGRNLQQEIDGVGDRSVSSGVHCASVLSGMAQHGLAMRRARGKVSLT